MLKEDARLICPIGYYDANGIAWNGLKNDITDRLPLRDVTWKSPISSTFITIGKLPLRFLPSNANLFKDSDHPYRWFLAPYVHLYLISVESSDAYKALKVHLKSWVESHSGVKRASWLIVYAPQGNYPFDHYIKIYNRIATDFHIERAGDRTVMIANRSVAKPPAIYEASMQELLLRIREGVVASFQQRSALYDADIRHLDSFRGSPQLEFRQLFLVKESLALMYQMMQMPNEALIQYEELEALLAFAPPGLLPITSWPLAQSDIDCSASAAPGDSFERERASTVGSSGGDVGTQLGSSSSGVAGRETEGATGGGWQATCRNGDDVLLYSINNSRMRILKNECSVLELFRYLFARQMYFLVVQQRSWLCAEKGALFVRSVCAAVQKKREQDQLHAVMDNNSNNNSNNSNINNLHSSGQAEGDIQGLLLDMWSVAASVKIARSCRDYILRSYVLSTGSNNNIINSSMCNNDTDMLLAGDSGGPPQLHFSSSTSTTQPSSSSSASLSGSSSSSSNSSNAVYVRALADTLYSSHNHNDGAHLSSVNIDASISISPILAASRHVAELLRFAAARLDRLVPLVKQSQMTSLNMSEALCGWQDKDRLLSVFSLETSLTSAALSVWSTEQTADASCVDESLSSVSHRLRALAHMFSTQGHTQSSVTTARHSRSRPSEDCYGSGTPRSTMTPSYTSPQRDRDSLAQEYPSQLDGVTPVSRSLFSHLHSGSTGQQISVAGDQQQTPASSPGAPPVLARSHSTQSLSDRSVAGGSGSVAGGSRGRGWESSIAIQLHRALAEIDAQCDRSRLACYHKTRCADLLVCHGGYLQALRLYCDIFCTLSGRGSGRGSGASVTESDQHCLSHMVCAASNKLAAAGGGGGPGTGACTVASECLMRTFKTPPHGGCGLDGAWAEALYVVLRKMLFCTRALSDRGAYLLVSLQLLRPVFHNHFVTTHAMLLPRRATLSTGAVTAYTFENSPLSVLQGEVCSSESASASDAVKEEVSATAVVVTGVIVSDAPAGEVADRLTSSQQLRLKLMHDLLDIAAMQSNALSQSQLINSEGADGVVRTPRKVTSSTQSVAPQIPIFLATVTLPLQHFFTTELFLCEGKQPVTGRIVRRVNDECCEGHQLCFEAGARAQRVFLHITSALPCAVTVNNISVSFRLFAEELEEAQALAGEGSLGDFGTPSYRSAAGEGQCDGVMQQPVSSSEGEGDVMVAEPARDDHDHDKDSSSSSCDVVIRPGAQVIPLLLRPSSTGEYCLHTVELRLGTLLLFTHQAPPLYLSSSSAAGVMSSSSGALGRVRRDTILVTCPALLFDATVALPPFTPLQQMNSVAGGGAQYARVSLQLLPGDHVTQLTLRLNSSSHSSNNISKINSNSHTTAACELSCSASNTWQVTCSRPFSVPIGTDVCCWEESVATDMSEFTLRNLVNHSSSESVTIVIKVPFCMLVSAKISCDPFDTDETNDENNVDPIQSHAGLPNPTCATALSDGVSTVVPLQFTCSGQLRRKCCLIPFAFPLCSAASTGDCVRVQLIKDLTDTSAHDQQMFICQLVLSNVCSESVTITDFTSIINNISNDGLTVCDGPAELIGLGRRQRGKAAGIVLPPGRSFHAAFIFKYSQRSSNSYIPPHASTTNIAFQYQLSSDYTSDDEDANNVSERPVFYTDSVLLTVPVAAVVPMFEFDFHISTQLEGSMIVGKCSPVTYTLSARVTRRGACENCSSSQTLCMTCAKLLAVSITPQLNTFSPSLSPSWIVAGPMKRAKVLLPPSVNDKHWSMEFVLSYNLISTSISAASLRLPNLQIHLNDKTFTVSHRGSQEGLVKVLPSCVSTGLFDNAILNHVKASGRTIVDVRSFP